MKKDSFAKKHDQKIDCDVKTCKHQNSEENCCRLPSIKVCGCSSDVEEKESTICDSFECGCNSSVTEEKED